MASKRRVRRQQCGNKIRHTSEAAAALHVDSLRYAQTVNVQAYHCPFCHHWHVGRRKAQVDD